MIKKSIHVISILIALVVFAGCNSAQNTSGGVNEKGVKKLSVYASFYPMYDFAKKVGGDKIEITNLVPAGTEPHDWEPAPSDITGLEKADIFIYNGAGMEHWVDKVIGSLQNKRLVALETAKGLHLLEGQHHEEEHEDDEHGKFDPHVWLNPMNAKLQMAAIKDAFAAADPANKDYYEANYDKYAKEFDKLDEEFKTGLAELPNKEIIVAHAAFGYLCGAYGLNQSAIEGLTPDSEPDPARMSEIIKFAKEHKVNTIFFEELVNPKVAQTIANAIGAKTEVLNPLEGISDEKQKAGEDYFSVMRQNLKVIIAALK